MPTMFDVFVSHSHRDEARAKALVKRLEGWGISVYVDLDDKLLSSLPKPELAEQLTAKLRCCRLLVFAFSEEALNSRWMPWELGLAHGVIGRVVLWPFTKRALGAQATQEYLNLYETLEPAKAQDRLKALLQTARSSSIRPADLRMMQDLANVTAEKGPELKNPAVASEFMAYGPTQLYFEWLNEILKMWKLK